MTFASPAGSSTLVYRTPTSRVSVLPAHFSSALKLLKTSAVACELRVGNTSRDMSELWVLPRFWQSWRFSMPSSMSSLERIRVGWTLGHGGLSFTVLNSDGNSCQAVMAQLDAFYEREEDDALLLSPCRESTWRSTPPAHLPPALSGGMTGKQRLRETGVWPREQRDTLTYLYHLQVQGIQLYTAKNVVSLDNLNELARRELALIDAKILRITACLGRL